DHGGEGGRSDAQRPGDRRGRRALPGRLELVDLLQVVLDRDRELRFRHVSILGEYTETMLERVTTMAHRSPTATRSRVPWRRRAATHAARACRPTCSLL